MWIATAEHSRHLDRRAADEFGMPANVLMERAGMAVYEAMREMLPEGGAVTVFAGKGNNGGDGLVVARLARNDGFSVDCLVAAREEDLTDDATAQVRAARAHGVYPVFWGDARYERRLECLGGRDLVVDALLGLGADRDVCGPVRDAIEAINRSGVPVLAIDVPSGIHPDTGEELGESIWALRTVTLGLPKPFLFQNTGLEHSGYWSVAPIGLPIHLTDEPTFARLLDGEFVAGLLPERMRSSHKGENGHLLVVAGSHRMRGAAVLVAEAALRSGAGLVTVAGTAEVCNAAAARLPEALLLPLPERDGAIDVGAAEILAHHPSHAAVFGPGLSHAESVLAMLAELWPNWNRPCVIDADALNAVARGVRLPNSECVLTPHPGEMSRLLQLSVAEIQLDRFRTVQNALDRFGCCTLLKGPYTVLGEPGSPLLVNGSGNPGMASGGMGDVLCGVIGTLLAQKMGPLAAAAAGVFWHGQAADACAESSGPVGYLASEVARALPSARAKILSSCGPASPWP
jgi:NAD(P)H-hydrate epimerase